MVESNNEVVVGEPVPVAYGVEPQEENKNERRNNEQEAELVGVWAWKYDGATKNGDIILKRDGSLSHKCNWSGGSWKMNE